MEARRRNCLQVFKNCQPRRSSIEVDARRTRRSCESARPTSIKTTSSVCAPSKATEASLVSQGNKPLLQTCRIHLLRARTRSRRRSWRVSLTRSCRWKLCALYHSSADTRTICGISLMSTSTDSRQPRPTAKSLRRLTTCPWKSRQKRRHLRPRRLPNLLNSRLVSTKSRGLLTSRSRTGNCPWTQID